MKKKASLEARAEEYFQYLVRYRYTGIDARIEGAVDFDGAQSVRASWKEANRWLGEAKKIEVAGGR